jgi:hypothetical protein
LIGSAHSSRPTSQLICSQSLSFTEAIWLHRLNELRLTVRPWERALICKQEAWFWLLLCYRLAVQSFISPFPSLDPSPLISFQLGQPKFLWFSSAGHVALQYCFLEAGPALQSFTLLPTIYILVLTVITTTDFANGKGTLRGLPVWFLCNHNN